MVYRDSTAPPNLCPRCHKALDPVECAGVHSEQCHHCGGTWVTEAVLLRMWDRLAPLTSPPPFAPRAYGAPEAPCATCRKPMDRVELFTVPLDRCRTHGIWFDRRELETVLASSMMSYSEWVDLFFFRLREMF